MGHVDKFATIIPNSVILRGQVGSPIKQTVRIIPEKKYPFKIIGHSASHGNNIQYALEQIKRSEGIEYVLKVENRKQLAGNYYNTITLKTDSKIQPCIVIRVKGYIQEHQSKSNKIAPEKQLVVYPKGRDAHPVPQTK